MNIFKQTFMLNKLFPTRKLYIDENKKMEF